MKKIFSIFSIAILFVIGFACSEDENNSSSGTLVLEFDNVVGTSNLVLNTGDRPYTNGHDEAYNVTWLSYYVSSIRLKREDGTFYEDRVKADGSAGYYLVNEAEAESHEIVLKNIPAGNYTDVTFTLGVDANQVNQGAQTGPLDPANGLFWNWNSGYIFMAIEGTSPASTETDNAFAYHVGGYKEDPENDDLVNNIKTVTLSFKGDMAPVKASHQPQVHIIFDVKKLLNGPGADVSFATNAQRHTPKSCEDIAGNIEAAFVVDHIHAD